MLLDLQHSALFLFRRILEAGAVFIKPSQCFDLPHVHASHGHEFLLEAEVLLFIDHCEHRHRNSNHDHRRILFSWILPIKDRHRFHCQNLAELHPCIH